jgi:hypothetical protein
MNGANGQDASLSVMLMTVLSASCKTFGDVECGGRRVEGRPLVSFEKSAEKGSRRAP